MLNKSMVRVRILLDELKTTYPAFAENKPLTRKTQEVLAAVYKDTPKRNLSSAIKKHVSQIEYHEQVLKNDYRYNLDGTITDELITQREKKHAKESLDKLKKTFNKRRSQIVQSRFRTTKTFSRLRKEYAMFNSGSPCDPCSVSQVLDKEGLKNQDEVKNAFSYFIYENKRYLYGIKEGREYVNAFGKETGRFVTKEEEDFAQKVIHNFLENHQAEMDKLVEGEFARMNESKNKNKNRNYSDKHASKSKPLTESKETVAIKKKKRFAFK